MIVVLADDLSGAAELAGIALRHGLSAEVQTAFHPATDADVVCLDSDSRLLTATDAASRVSAIARAVLAARPDWIFKKCDSVLRGPVLAEARAVADAAGLPRLLIMPANPSRGRVIRDGLYFVGDRPLHEGGFASDPIHPRKTSRVADLLGGDLCDIAVPDAATTADVQRHARNLDASTLPVGAADFFAALLTARTSRQPGATKDVDTAADPTLAVCGSAASWPQRHAEARAHGIPAFPLPHDVSAIKKALSISPCVLLGIGDGPDTHGQSPDTLSTYLSDTVAALLRPKPPGRLLLEGGATAAEIIRALGWTRLSALAVSGDVAVLRAVGTESPQLFIKPGSYPWPESLWPR